MKRHQEQGFTLIEVTLATVFVGFIVMILAAMAISIIGAYNKGLWLAQINQAGQQLNADIGDQARYSTAATVISGSRRICVGGVSYLWNTETDNRDPGKNKFTDGSKFGLLRIDDPNMEYCSNLNKMPAKTDTAVQSLLGSGAVIQEFKVTQGVSGNSNVPLLTLKTVMSTGGDNRPIRAYVDGGGANRIDTDGSKGGEWQCGEWIDTNHNNQPDDADEFTPAANQHCAFAQYDITVYERSRR